MTSHAIHPFATVSFFDDVACSRGQADRPRRGFAEFAMFGFVLIVAILHLASATLFHSAASSLETNTAIVGP